MYRDFCWVIFNVDNFTNLALVGRQQALVCEVGDNCWRQDQWWAERCLFCWWKCLKTLLWATDFELQGLGWVFFTWIVPCSSWILGVCCTFCPFTDVLTMLYLGQGPVWDVQKWKTTYPPTKQKNPSEWMQGSLMSMPTGVWASRSLLCRYLLRKTYKLNQNKINPNQNQPNKKGSIPVTVFSVAIHRPAIMNFISCFLYLFTSSANTACLSYLFLCAFHCIWKYLFKELNVVPLVLLI